MLWVDGDLMERVFVNLLENAVRYTPPGTKIEISASHSADRVEIVVADDGPGLPTGGESKIFERFFRGRTWSPMVRPESAWVCQSVRLSSTCTRARFARRMERKGLDSSSRSLVLPIAKLPRPTNF